MAQTMEIGRRVPLVAMVLLVTLLGALRPARAAAGTLIQLPVDATAALVNGGEKTLDVPAQIEGGRTMVPLRFVGESLGANIGWDEAQRMVTYTLGHTQINLFIDNTHATVNGSDVVLDVPPHIVNGRTLVPVRFVSEQLGAVVGWEASARTVWIALGDVPNLVIASGFRFSRTGFAVAAGTPIVFVNGDMATHTVTGGSIDSGDLSHGEAFIIRNLPPGNYSIHCMHHPSMLSAFTITA